MNFSWEYQEFDTAVLGLKTAKIIFIDPSDLHTHIAALLKDLKNHGILYATYRFPAVDFPLIHALERHKFHLIDILVSLSLDLKNFKISHVDGEHIVKPLATDHEELIRLASHVFSFNRYFNDPLIPQERAQAVFGKWVENSLSGKVADEVLVYKEEKILGFITLQKKGHIPLIGVAQEARGKGIAKKLILSAIRRFVEMNLEKTEIETQLINTPALRAYENCGFKHIGSYVTYRISL